MTWGLAKNAARWAATVFSRRDLQKTDEKTGSHGHVPRIEPILSANGSITSQTMDLIDRRAIRKAGNNRPEVAENYRRVHLILGKGR